MKRCPACGDGYRLGRTVLLFGADGRERRARVCPKCAARGVTIVAERIAPVVKRGLPGDALEKAQQVIRELRTFATMAASTAKAEPQSSPERVFLEGRAEGFCGAIEAIRRAFGLGGES